MDSTVIKKIKVLMALSALDSHDRAWAYVSKVLREAGMEVILSRYHTANEVVPTAMQESANVIGLSFYSGGCMHDTSIVMRQLKENKMEDTIVVIGGAIPPNDVPKLLEMGVKGIFGPGDPVEGIVDCITSCLKSPQEGSWREDIQGAKDALAGDSR